MIRMHRCTNTRMCCGYFKVQADLSFGTQGVGAYHYVREYNDFLKCDTNMKRSLYYRPNWYDFESQGVGHIHTTYESYIVRSVKSEGLFGNSGRMSVPESVANTRKTQVFTATTATISTIITIIYFLPFQCAPCKLAPNGCPGCTCAGSTAAERL